MKRASLFVGILLVVVGSSLRAADEDCRTGVSQKGSLLLFPAIEVEWKPGGEVSVDTFVQITNDFFEDVRVQMFFVNGDPPLEEVIAGDPPQLVAEGEPGWNFADCQFELTADQTRSWSAVRGMEGGCGPFTVLDPRGRPNPERSAGFRMLRGYLLAWAVDDSGGEIRWNHLSGHATSVDYREVAAFEYGAYAFQVRSGQNGAAADARPGLLLLNGREYDALPDVLLWTFEAAGASRIFDLGGVVSSNTDLTLMPGEADFREAGFPRVTTTARYDIWNENERRFSGTQHEVTCWHQRLLSRYPNPNHLILSSLQTNRGKARIDGVGGVVCGPPSLPAPLVGVAKRELMFGVVCAGTALSSATLTGMGCESGAILYDPSGALPGGSQTAESGLDAFRGHEVKGQRRVRTSSQAKVGGKN